MSYFQEAFDADIFPQMMAEVPDHFRLTVLQAAAPLTKAFSVEDGRLVVSPYQQAKHFRAVRHTVRSLHDLMALVRVTAEDSHACLIRGVAPTDLARTQRSNVIFPEPKMGCHWAMLDFDGVELPEDMHSLGPEAVEHVVSRLPPPFRQASYGYQLSSSAGVRNTDGSLRKPGLSVHLFFWFNRPVPGKLLVAYLRAHCLDTEFFRLGFQGAITLQYGIDMATINSSSQPHYIAHPMISQGVCCDLADQARIRLVEKDTHQVTLPEITADLSKTVARRAHILKDAERIRLGLRLRKVQTRTARGVNVQMVLDLPARGEDGQRRGRVLTGVDIDEDRESVIFKFADEKTPGSWFVQRHSPTVAHRFGDFAAVALRDLSTAAYHHVRDQLRWFIELPTEVLSLDDRGFLPPLDSFARAKLSLILAPTGSGKTTALAAWIRPLLAVRAIVVYAAPRIALVQQTHRDLIEKNVLAQIYTEIGSASVRYGGVLLTTTHSLPRILSLVYEVGMPHILVFDEVHMALDEFMRGKRSLEFFERSITHASRSLFLTGTMTDLQRVTLSQVITHAMPALSADDYACYEFTPVRQFPLQIRSAGAFAEDILELFGEFQKHRVDGRTLPRTVFILDTSKLLVFRKLLEQFDLKDLADVVSRKENSDDDIEEAVVSDKPILITTSLFGVGLNFRHPPKLLWCCFNKIPADTNQVVQTINRANRTADPCEVRIYADRIDHAPIVLPENSKPAQVLMALRDEASLEGLLEQHFHVDRVVYGAMRKVEKNTPKALGELVRMESFQNYVVSDLDLIAKSDKKAKDRFAGARAAARDEYDARVLQAATKFLFADNPLNAFPYLERLYQERASRFRAQEPRVEADINNDRFGVFLRLCELDRPSMAREVDEFKLAVLFGERFPWVSSQYDPTTDPSYGKVVAEKLGNVVEVLRFMGHLQRRELSEGRMVSLLTRREQLRQGFLCLEHGDLTYQALHEEFAKLKAARDLVRTQSQQARKKVHDHARELIGRLVKPLGVHFKKERVGRVTRINYEKPVVPSAWDIEGMILNLQGHAERFSVLPPGAPPLSMRIASDEKGEAEPPRNLELCVKCAFLWRGWCCRGNPVDFQNLRCAGNAAACVDFVALSRRHKAIVATRSAEFVADVFEKVYMNQCDAGDSVFM